VRWHRFTSQYASRTEWISEAYFKLIKLEHSPELQALAEGESRLVNKPYKGLFHYRVFLDETGTHEFIAESVSASWVK